MLKNVRYAKCVKCGKEYEATPNTTTCECGGILDIVYNYNYIKSTFNKGVLSLSRERSMWRYRPLLPVEPTSPPTPLRVGWSPLYKADNLAKELGIKTLYIKDDGQNPTASLKDRASAMAVVKAREAGAATIACSSTGNAASSLAGNAAAAGIPTYIFVPARAPKGKVAQLRIFGATVISVTAPMRRPLNCPRPPLKNGAGTTATPPSTPICPRAKRLSHWRSWSSWTGRFPTISPSRWATAVPLPARGRV